MAARLQCFRGFLSGGMMLSTSHTNPTQRRPLPEGVAHRTHPEQCSPNNAQAQRVTVIGGRRKGCCEIFVGWVPTHPTLLSKGSGASPALTTTGASCSGALLRAWVGLSHQVQSACRCGNLNYVKHFGAHKKQPHWRGLGKGGCSYLWLGAQRRSLRAYVLLTTRNARPNAPSVGLGS
jgi:hypothetical protein